MLGQFNFRRVIKIPVPFGGHPIKMGLLEPQPEEEGLVAFGDHFLHGCNGSLGIISVGVVVIGYLSGLICRAVTEATPCFGTVFPGSILQVTFPDLKIFSKCIGKRPGKSRDILDRIPTPGFLVIGKTTMVNLAAVCGFIALGNQVLRKGYNLWIGVPKIGVVFNHSERIRSRTGHKACPGRTADRLLAISTIEEQSILSQGVQVGRDG